MKKSDLYREWARVLDMCEGTNVDPENCWKFGGILISKTPVLTDDPVLYSFAVAIVEDKPVFVGDKVWDALLGRFVEIEDGDHINLLIDDGKATWQPPKNTFTLNGEELPCPSKCEQYGFQLGICGGDGHSFTCMFRSLDERSKVADAIIKLLKDATK